MPEDIRTFRTFRGYALEESRKSLTASMEDYVEMLFRLSAKARYVRLTELGSALNVQPPSVTAMVHRLAAAGLVDYRKYGILQLTERGNAVGAYLLRRHQLLEGFMQLIGVQKNALKDAERIEHIVSDELVARIHALSEFARENPAWWQEFTHTAPPGGASSQSYQSEEPPEQN